MLGPNAKPFASRNLRRERRLWHDQQRHAPSLGCEACLEKSFCGGLAIQRALFSCLDLCCRRPEACDVVCRHHPDFPFRVREVGGFDLNTIGRVTPGPSPVLPAIIPMVFDRTSRMDRFAPPVAALSLYRFFKRSTGELRFGTREALLERFALGSNTKVVLSGTDCDSSLERWWKLSKTRLKLIRGLRDLGITAVTTPNYSMLIDQPRWDDLHAMKRIGLVHEEFLSEGLSCALHVNARTEMDARRWTDYIAARPEITHIAYEFATGTGRAARQPLHASWLAQMARTVGRPLRLIVRGGHDVLPILAGSFQEVSIIETSIYIKTMKRRRAVVRGPGLVTWKPVLTLTGEPLDCLLSENYQAVEGCLRPVVRPVSP